MSGPSVIAKTAIETAAKNVRVEGYPCDGDPEIGYRPCASRYCYWGRQGQSATVGVRLDLVALFVSSSEQLLNSPVVRGPCPTLSRQRPLEYDLESIVAAPISDKHAMGNGNDERVN